MKLKGSGDAHFDDVEGKLAQHQAPEAREEPQQPLAGPESKFAEAGQRKQEGRPRQA